MNKCTFISKRYIKGKKSCLAGSHWLSLIGIIIGVSALLLILTVMNGMRDVIIKRIISSSPEMELNLNDDDNLENITKTLESFDFVKYINFVNEEDLVIIHKNETILSKFIGINLEKFQENNDILNKIVYSNTIQRESGLISGHNNIDFFKKDGAFIGYELSRRYGINLGDKITVISLNKDNFSSFGRLPLSETFTIQGIYSNLIPELESSIVYVADINLKSFSKSNRLYNKINIYTNDFSKANSYKKEIQAVLENNAVNSWSDKNSNLYNAQKLEKTIMSFILGLIIILSSFNLTGSFLKKVSNKKREIGILSTLGFSKKDIMTIFLNQGIILGIIGVFVGNCLAIILLQIQIHFNVITMPANISHLFPTLPISIQVSDFIYVSSFSFTFSILSSLFPIYRIKRLNPIELIKE